MSKMKYCCIFEKDSTKFNLTNLTIVKVYGVNQGYVGDCIRRLYQCKSCGAEFVAQIKDNHYTFIQVKDEAEANKFARKLEDFEFFRNDRAVLQFDGKLVNFNNIEAFNKKVSDKERDKAKSKAKRARQKGGVIDNIVHFFFEEEETLPESIEGPCGIPNIVSKSKGRSGSTKKKPTRAVKKPTERQIQAKKDNRD